MAEDAVIIELVGLPGAGKSTVAHAAAKILRKKGIQIAEPTYVLNHESSTIRRRMVKLSLVLGTAIWRPNVVRCLFKKLLTTQQRTFSDLITVVMNTLYIWGLAYRILDKKGIFILDQGLHQALWTVTFSGAGGISVFLEDIERLFTITGGKLVVAFLECELDTAYARVVNRAVTASRITEQDSRHYALRQALEALSLTTQVALELHRRQQIQIELLWIANGHGESIQAGSKKLTDLLLHTSIKPAQMVRTL